MTNSFDVDTSVEMVSFTVQQDTNFTVKEHVPRSSDFCVLKNKNNAAEKEENYPLTLEYSQIWVKLKSLALK